MQQFKKVIHASDLSPEIKLVSRIKTKYYCYKPKPYFFLTNVIINPKIKYININKALKTDYS